MGNTERVSTLAYSLIFAGAWGHVSGIKISGEKGSELARGIQDKQPVFTFQEVLPGTGIRVERTESKAGAVPTDETDKDVMNTLYYGDNLVVMRKHSEDESIDLCYIDPPFNPKRTYNQIYLNKQKDKNEP